MKCKTAVVAVVALLGILASGAALAAGESAVPKIDIVSLPTYADPAALPLSDIRSGNDEQWERFAGDRIVRNVVAPTLTPVLPDPRDATGAAVIVAPGGAFMMLSIDNEGYDVAHWLARHGIAAFVLKYRLTPTPRDPQAYLGSLLMLMQKLSASSGKDFGANAPPTPADTLADAQAAVRLVRRNAAQWHIDPARVGFVGFSAGAMTTLSVGLGEDKASRPDFIAPIYGPMSAKSIPVDAPPMFAALAADDPLMGRGDFGLIQSYKAAGRPFELHVFETGGHGFGMKTQHKTSDLWIEQFYAWMKDRGLLAQK